MPSQSRSARQLPRTRGSQVYARGWRLNSGKANLKSGFSCRMSTVKGAAFSLSPRRGDVAQRQGGHIKRVAGCAAEALPAAETAEVEQGQRSAFCEGAATPEAKAGHRNPGDLDTNNAGASLYSRPPQRDPIFRDAKVLLFWCDQQQKELLVRYFLFAVTSDGCVPELINDLSCL